MYKSIANFYDQIVADINYSKYADYIEKIIKKNTSNTSMIADLGCGTGNLTILLKNKGYDLTGIDISSEMLEKCYKKDKDILWVNQDMTDFDLFGTYDVFVSFLDSINHITDKRKLKKTFKLVYTYLNKGGLFIFDINTIYKFENIYKNIVYYMVEKQLAYIWENHYNRKNKICDMDMTFFEKSGKTYKRYDDYHRERGNEISEIKEIARNLKFKIIGVYKEFTFNQLSKTDERAFFVLKKE